MKIKFYSWIKNINPLMKRNKIKPLGWKPLLAGIKKFNKRIRSWMTATLKTLMNNKIKIEYSLKN